MLQSLGTAYLAWLATWMAVASLVAFVAFGLDKRAARKQRRRIPEFQLHLLELAGGWPGAILAAFVFRHKIRKPSYLFVLMLVIGIWVAAALLLMSLGGGSEST